MDVKKKRIYSGREITEEDIEMIQWVLDTYKGLSRSETIYTISELLEWYRPEDGVIKSRQCQDCLEALESEGIIVLPKAKERKKGTTQFLEEMPEYEEVNESGNIYLVRPKDKTENKLWRSYIHEYHPLGYKREDGAGLRYFIKYGDTELGCMQFTSAAWSLENRDKWIGWDKETRVSNLRLIANNTRYLLLPWAKMPYLASKALGQVARQIQEDWLKTYGYAPVLLETFVDSSMYAGTCYKAANWIYAGATTGRGRDSKTSKATKPIKDVWLYPLHRDMRVKLRSAEDEYIC